MTVSLITAAEKMGPMWLKAGLLILAALFTACSVDTPQGLVKVAPKCQVVLYDAITLIEENAARRVGSDDTGAAVVAVENCGDAVSNMDAVLTVPQVGIVSGGAMVKYAEGVYIYPELIQLPIVPEASVMVYVFINGKMRQHKAF